MKKAVPRLSRGVARIFFLSARAKSGKLSAEGLGVRELTGDKRSF